MKKGGFCRISDGERWCDFTNHLLGQQDHHSAAPGRKQPPCFCANTTKYTHTVSTNYLYVQ